MTEQQMEEMLRNQEAFKEALISGYKSDWPEKEATEEEEEENIPGEL